MPVKRDEKSDEALRILFCVNWAVEKIREEDTTRFSPDYCVPGEPYWFFRHGDQRFEVDVLDCRSVFGLHVMERRIARSYPLKSALAWLRSRSYDVIVSHGAQMGLGIALLQTLFPGVPSAPHVMFDVGAISGGAHGWNHPAVIKGFRFAFGSLAAAICHSSHQLEFYRQEYPHVATVAHFIPLGVDTEVFRPQDIAVEDEIICIGYALRDWDLLVRAYARLHAKTRLILLGVPAEQCISCPGVECVPRVNIEVMRQRIAKARFVVLPLPPVDFCIGQQTFLQSMAMGKAVLVSDIPAAKDYITDGENGFLYRAGNEDDLYEKLLYLLSADDVVKTAGQTARVTAMNRFSEKLMSEKIGGLLREVAMKNSGRRESALPTAL